MSTSTSMATEQVAWISGGAQGIGLELAKLLLKENGVKVALVDFCESEKGEAAASDCGEGAIFLRCDVCDRSGVQDSILQASKAFGVRCPSIFVNNAGIVDESRIDAMIDCNLRSIIHNSILQEKLLREAGMKGVIINTSSLAGLTVMPFAPGYHATKFGCVGWSLAFAESLQAESKTKVPMVRVNCACPALTESPAVGGFFKELLRRAGGFWKNMSEHPIDPRTVAEAMAKMILHDTFHGMIAALTFEKSWIYKPQLHKLITPPKGALILSKM
eukprot:TRINITY_DN10643_c0_g4_i1.p1 TRINITY_DN10643_c0_g4~~TRINITY_DN10643_c0_g4_i1.p1  ORF type:complete len:274 (+),score=55.31 TRINITY_DN10643_c0_g4_i1:63-884(+)